MVKKHVVNLEKIEISVSLIKMNFNRWPIYLLECWFITLFIVKRDDILCLMITLMGQYALLSRDIPKLMINAYMFIVMSLTDFVLFATTVWNYTILIEFIMRSAMGVGYVILMDKVIQLTK